MADTIAAVATAMTASGIGIIRISGPDSREIAGKIYRSKGGKKRIENVPSHTIQYGFICDEDEIIDSLVSSYLKGKFMNAMFNSKASEQSARMQAMDGATKNADDLLNSLDAKYNRIRQSIITQEISEIVGGAEAQK